MKALEKDRNRRYESANALARDVQRYLDDEPVEACPPSLRYRVGKVTRRHKGLLATAGAIFIALLMGTGIATWQAVLAEAAAQQAENKQAEAERNLKAAMDAVERLLANVSNPELANVPGLQETWAGILTDAVEFYERFKADSGSSSEVDYRAAMVFLHFGHLMTATKPDSQDAIRNYERGLELANGIVLKEPKRSDFRELLAQLHRGCADYYWMPKPMATAEYDAKTLQHFQSALQQYEHLATETPGKQDYLELQGFVFFRMANFIAKRTPKDPRIEEYIGRATNLGRERSYVGRAEQARLSGDPELSVEYWRKAIAAYRSDPDRFHADEQQFHLQPITKLWWAGIAAGAIVDEYPGEAAWIWEEGIKTSFDALQVFPSHRGYRLGFDRFGRAYARFLLRPERQQQALDTVNRLVNTSESMHRVRALVLEELGDADDQLEALNEAISKYPSQPQYYISRAGQWLDLGRLEDALADLNAALQLDKNDGIAIQKRGDVLSALQKYERAAADYTLFFELGGGIVDSVPSFKRRGLAYFRLGRFNEALADLQESLRRNPQDLSALTWIPPVEVATCPDRDFRNGVLELADRAVQLNERSPGSRRARSLLLLEMGQFERVRDDLSAIESVHADSYYPAYQAALVCAEAQ